MSHFDTLASFIDTDNSSTDNLNSGNSYTFTGEWVQTFQPDIMVTLFTDQECSIFVQFSHDGITSHSSLARSTTIGGDNNHRLFTTAVKGARYHRIIVTTDSLTTTSFDLLTETGVFRHGNAPNNLSVSLTADAQVTRPSSFQDEVTINRRLGVTPWNKFGFRETLTASGGEQTVWATTGNYSIPTSADTYTITYDGTGGGSTDGAGTNGALVLTFYHIDSNGLPEVITHTLETDGSDVTSFSGLGINRCVVSSSGSDNFNASAITITHTTSGNTMAVIPAEESVTQQCIFHNGSNHTAAVKFITFNVNRLSGSNPKVTVKGYVFNRAISTRFEVYRHIIDTQSENTVSLADPVNFRLNPTDVLYFVADTDRDNTIITMRFSINEYTNN